MTDPLDTADITAFIRSAQDSLRDLINAVRQPASPESQIRSWPLTIDYDRGDVCCGDLDHGCDEDGLLVEGTDIDGNQTTFTLGEIHDAVDEHIEMMRERQIEREEINHG